MQTITTPEKLLERAVNGGRVSLEEGLHLYQDGDDRRVETCRRRHPAAEASRGRRHLSGGSQHQLHQRLHHRLRLLRLLSQARQLRGLLLTNEQIGAKMAELRAWGGSRVLLQGGVNPYLKIDYYEGLLRYLKEHFPEIQIDGFSPVEVWNIARIMKMPLDEVLHRLHEAGMDGLPGGGAEILDNRTRNRIAPHKGTWESWIEAERLAQREGMTTSATMVFGFDEEPEERALHLTRLRELQDESQANNGNGFTSFIVWSYQPEQYGDGRHTLDGRRIPAHGLLRPLMLDNFENISASWPSQGARPGARGAALRRQRLRQHDDGGERGQRRGGRCGHLHDGGADPGRDSQGWLPSRQARQPLRDTATVRVAWRT